MSELKRKPIIAAALSDGTLVEAVYRADVHQTAFLVCRGDAIEEHSFFDVPRLGRAVPYHASNNLLTHNVVLLPSDAVEYSSDVALLSGVRAFVHRYADLSEAFEEVASHYVLLTWIYDAFSELPYLRVRGDWGSGKSRCLQTIGSICCRPMFASGASTTSPLFRILDAFRGTLVVDESDFRFSDEKSEIIKILNNGNSVGFPVLRSESTPTKEFNPTAFDVFGPKIIATRGPFEDQALESRCITETMSGLPPRPDIPLNLPNCFHEEALQLRNQLLMYRFRNRNAERKLEEFRPSGVEARIAQVFGPLMAIVRDDAARGRMISLARRKSGDLVAERATRVEAQILDIMFEMRRDGAQLGVKDITERFTERFGLDYDRPVTPRWIGAQLRKRLSLVPVKSHGVFVVSETEAPKLGALFKRYGLGDVGVDLGTSGTSGRDA